MSQIGTLIDFAFWHLDRNYGTEETTRLLKEQQEATASEAGKAVQIAASAIAAAAAIDNDPDLLYGSGVVPIHPDIPKDSVRFILEASGSWGTRQPVVDARIADIELTKAGIEVAGATVSKFKGSQYIPPRSTYTFAALIEAYMSSKYAKQHRNVANIRLAAVYAARRILARERKRR